MTRRRAIVGTAALMVVLTACGPTMEEGSIGVSSAPSVEPSRVVLPIEAYVVSGAEANAYNAAQGILTNRCLARFGFGPDIEVPAYTQAAATVSSLTARRYLLIDASQAETYGYHTGLTPAFVEQDRQRAALMAKAKEAAPTDPAQLAARGRVLNGVDAGSPADPSIPEGGCSGEANRALRGTTEGLSWSQTAIEVQQTSYDESLADDRVESVFLAWSSCMSAQGFTYPTPADANNDDAWSGDLPGTREIATAVADVACKEQTNVVDVWAGVEAEIQRRKIEEHAEVLRQMRADDEAALAKAADVVRGVRS